MVRGAAGEQDHPPEILGVDLEPFEIGVVAFDAQAGPERVGDGLRLLVNLLEHEVRVAALLRLRRVPGDGLGRPVHRRAVEGGELDARGGDLGDVSLLEEDHLAGALEERRHVGGEERLPSAEPDDERRGHLGGDDLAGVLLRHHRERVGAVHLGQRAADRLGQGRRAGGERLVDELGGDLGVGLRRDVPSGRL